MPTKQYRHIWFRLSTIGVLSGVLMFSAGVASPPPADAQGGTSPESVTYDPMTAALRPGDTQVFGVTGSSQVMPHSLEVMVPGDLQVIGEPSCRASALVVPFGSGNERARTEELSCTGNWGYEPEGHITRFTAESSTASQSALYYDLFLQFEIEVSVNAEPGMVYSLTAPLAGLHEAVSEARVEILNSSGARVMPLQTPTPIVTAVPTMPAAPTSDAGASSEEGAVFSPPRQSAMRNETFDLTLKPFLNGDGGQLVLQVTLPPELELVGSPSCSAVNDFTCFDPRTTVDRDGSTQLHWLLMYAPNDRLEFVITVKVKQSATPGTSVVVIAETSYLTSLRVPAPWQTSESEITIVAG